MKKFLILFLSLLVISVAFCGCSSQDSWKRSAFGIHYQELDQNLSSIMKDMGKIQGDNTIAELDTLNQKRSTIIRQYLPLLQSDALPEKYAPQKAAILESLNLYIQSGEHLHAANTSQQAGDSETSRIERDQSLSLSRDAAKELQNAVLDLDKN